jgi:YVTN family beta-propeller protein
MHAQSLLRQTLTIIYAVVIAGGVPALAQTVNTGATFGRTVNLGGEPRDIILDELRGRIYIVNANANRVEIYDYRDGRLTGQITVGTFPNAGAISPDGSTLFVTNVQSGSLTQIDLGTDQVRGTVSLPARPEGVAVGSDGRVLITTQGTGINASTNTLLLYDPRQDSGLQITAVPSPPTISTPNPLPAVTVGRPSTAFPGRLITTPDGNFIIGMVAINQTLTSASTTLFVYETASGTVLRSRLVTGQSTVLSISPDGSRFMAGSTLYDTASLNVIGQMNTANLPFFLNPTQQFFQPGFNVQFNFGGSAFTPDGEGLLSAFNFGGSNLAGQARAQANVMLVGNSRNLGVALGIKLPESVTGKMVTTSDGTRAFAISESGVIDLALDTLYDYPILQPDTNTVFLAVDLCVRGLAKATVRMANLGKGKLTYSIPAVVPGAGNAIVAQVSSGVAPSTVTFTMDPGRAGVTRQPGTNLYTGGAQNTGSPINLTFSSLEAINIPNVVRIFMNFRNTDQRGVVYPVPTTPSSLASFNGSEGLFDMVLDEPRGRLYISNSGYNRVEIFDTRRQRFLNPLEVGQLPHALAMSIDGGLLYVGNTGGESLQVIDLETLRIVDTVVFPPIPRNGQQLAQRPTALAMTLSGLQFLMATGSNVGAASFWKLTGNEASPRAQSPVVPVTITGPHYMNSSNDGRQMVAMAGNGTSYLFDGLADAFTVSRTVYTQPPISYFGPLGAGPTGGYFLAGGQILSPALTPIGGSERPGVTQFSAPTAPGQPPQQTIVSAGQRNVAAVHPLNDRTFLRMTTPVRQNITAATRDDARTVLELVDLRTGAESVAGVIPENPVYNVFNTQRANVGARQMVVDSKGENAYMITLSGLTVAPLMATSGATQPTLPLGVRAIVNSTDGTPNYRPGSFITISGRNLASESRADVAPLPTLLGGTCVSLNDVLLPLISTANGQIAAQIPESVRPGQAVLQIRSLSTAQQSDPLVVTVQRPAQ